MTISMILHFSVAPTHAVELCFASFGMPTRDEPKVLAFENLECKNHGNEKEISARLTNSKANAHRKHEQGFVRGAIPLSITHFFCPPSAREFVKAEKIRGAGKCLEAKSSNISVIAASLQRRQLRLHFYAQDKTSRPRSGSGDLATHNKSCLKKKRSCPKHDMG